jgi:hypothetical protein
MMGAHFGVKLSKLKQCWNWKLTLDNRGGGSRM